MIIISQYVHINNATKLYIALRQNAPWNATDHPLAIAASLSTPKPDFAVGYRAMDPTVGEVATIPVWSRAFVAALERKAGLYLVSRVANSASSVDQKVALGILTEETYDRRRYSPLPLFRLRSKIGTGSQLWSRHPA